MKIEGGCHCGSIRFEAEVDSATVVICHCTDCQTFSGSAFRTVVQTKPGTFALLSGAPKVYVKTAESRQQTPANVLPDVRHADLLRSRYRGHQGGRAACRRNSSARAAPPARSILVPLVAGLAAEPVEDKEAGQATDPPRDGRPTRILTEAGDCGAYRVTACAGASAELAAKRGLSERYLGV